VIPSTNQAQRDVDRERPLTVTVETAGRVLGISRGLAYELVRRGDLRAIRLGRRLVVPMKAIDELLDGVPRLER
jgi:excisionase family DNA binding protein